MDIVTETNVLAAGLLSPFGACGKIVRMVSAGELTLSFDARILSEYGEVLRRPKFGFEEEKVAAFLEVALASRAESLVTGNQKHFPAERCQGATVISPDRFLIFYRTRQTERKRTAKRAPRTRKPRAG